MQRLNPYTSAPSDLRIGDHTLLSLTISITTEARKGDALKLMKLISWSIRYAFICGCQRGANEANETMEALLARLPAEPPKSPVEDGIEATIGFTRPAR